MEIVIQWIFLVLVIWTAPSTSLICYQCWCPSFNTAACNCSNTSDVEGSHCIIVEELHSSNPYIELSSTFLDSSYIRLKDSYYIILDESIFYHEITKDLKMKTKRIVYGCDWNYCNEYSLISLLPDSFKLTMDKKWLEENIYGNGSVNACHTFSKEICGNQIHPINYDQSTFTPCNNPTTCSLYNVWHDVETDESCYRSECTKSVLEDDSNEDNQKYKVQVEAIVYLSQNRSNFEIWKLNINCAVYNCTRSSIFQDVKGQIRNDINNLMAFPTVRRSPIDTPLTVKSTLPAHPLACYNCSCTGTTCPCTTYEISSADNTYCSITRRNSAQDVQIKFGHINTNTSYTYIHDYPYVLIEESIIYDETSSRWNTRVGFVIYGCNWHLCNKPELVPYLPTSFQMSLPEAWLNSNILGTGQPARDCHVCSDGPVCSDSDFIDGDQCPIQLCDTTCLVATRFTEPTSTGQCYESYCAPSDQPNFEIDKHRVEIEGVIYANNPTNVELWEIDLYCRADNCTRPEIFKELRTELVNQGDLSIFFNMITIPTTTPTPPIKPTLSCYECACYNDPACPCNTVRPDDASLTYCIMVRINDVNGDFTVYLEHIERNTTRVYIRKFPYLLAEESILYNETTKEWTTRTNVLIYGCNWNLCNHPSLVTLIPDSFKMTLSDEWLNANVLDSGAPDRDCHECRDAPQCGTTDFLDASRCPVQACNNTCIVLDIFDEPSSNLSCYQSYCSPPEADVEENQHRVELEGIFYGDQPDVVELWEIDLYCRADDCSRPTIFQEIRENLTVDTDNLTLLLDNSSRPIVEPEIICYDCFCYDDPDCACDKYTVSSASSSYCTIIRDNFDQDFLIALEHIDRNSTRVYIREFPYLLVEESIIYDEITERWNTRNNVVVFGCNWNYCNHPRLVPHLPDSFQMRLPETWLNSNILGTGQPVRECHECPNAPQCGTTEFLDATRCPIRSCNTTCFVSDKFDDPTTGLLCYQSFCAPDDSEFFTIDPHRVALEGVIYGSRPRYVELWEIDIFCRADDCSRPEIFNEIRQNLCVDLGDYTIFLGNTSTVGQDNETTTCPVTTTTRTTTSGITVSGTTTPSITASGTTTSRMPTSSITNAATSTERTTIIPETTTSFGQTTARPTGTTITAESGPSIYVAHNIFILFFLLISLINLY